MPSAFDILDSARPQEPTGPVEDTSPGQFGKGLRSGLYGVGSQLAALGGNVAEAAGAEGIAKAGYDKSREWQEAAAANAPRVASYKKVLDSPDLATGLRNAWDYGTGLAGQMVPGVVAGVGGALLTENPLVGATLMTAPMEAGDVVQRQQADPNLRALPAGERLGRAAVTGLGSAALQGVVPAGVAGRIAEGAAGRSVGQAVGRATLDVPVQGVAAAGGEAAKQIGTNPNKPLDTEAIGEAGVGGAVAGLGMGGLGLGGELAHKAVAAPGKTLGRVGDAVSDALPPSVKAAGDRIASAASDAAGAVVDAGKKAATDPVGTLRDLYDGAKTKAQDFVARVARGEDVADKAAVDEATKAGADQGAIQSLLGKLDGERVEAVKQWGSDLLTKAGLPPEKQAEITKAMGNLTDKGAQAVIAKAQQGWEAAQQAGKAVSGVMSDFASRMSEAKTRFQSADAGGAKRSDDYSALHGDLLDAISPLLRDSNPAIFEDNAAGAKARQDTGRALRMVLESYRNGGELGSDDLFKLIGAFGERAVDILDRTANVMGWRSDARSKMLYDRLNEMRAQKREDDSTLGLMMRSLDPSLQETTKTSDLRAELQALREWASAPDKDTATGRFDHESVVEEVRSRYGDKADDILNAVENEARAKSGQHMLDKDHAAVDEHGNEIDKSWEATHGQAPDETDAREGDTADAHVIDYGPESGKNAGGLALHPGLDHPEYGQAKQAWRRAKAENPDKSVSFVGAKELGENHPRVQEAIKRLVDGGMDEKAAKTEVMSMVKGDSGEMRPKYGVVQAESGDMIPGTIDKNNLYSVTLAAKGEKAKTSHRENESVFSVDGRAFDARKLVKEMSRQFAGEYTAEDDKGHQHRIGRMFMTGLAALSDHLGKTPEELPDSLVLDGRGTTLGEVRKLGYAPEFGGEGGEHKSSAQIGTILTAKRNVIARMEEKLNDRIAKLEGRGVDVDTDMGVSRMRDRLEALGDQAKRTETWMRKTERDERLAQDLEAHGKQEADPFGNIHEQADERVQPITVDMAGNGRDQTDPRLDAKRRVPNESVKAMMNKIDAIDEVTKSAGGKKIVERARELISNLDVLPKAAGLRLASILNESATPAAIGGIVNELHGNYKSQFRQEYTQKAAPEKVAPKAEAKPALGAMRAKTIDRMIETDNYESLKTGKYVDAFLEDAALRYADLRAKGDARSDAEDSAFYNLKQMLAGDSFAGANDLGSYYREVGEKVTDAQARERIAKAVPEVAAFVSPKGEARRSMERTGDGRLTPEAKRAVEDYMHSVLGDTVRTVFAKLDHAGEFHSRQTVQDIVKISTRLANPMNAAYHESVHGFFKRLMEQGNIKVAEALKRAALSDFVQKQLREHFADNREVLAQLSDPEEAAAYMYQLWAAGTPGFQVAPVAKTFFGHMAEAVRRVFGVWSQGERAEAIMDYFKSGEFKANMSRPDEVSRVLIEAGHNKALDKLQAISKPVMDVAGAFALAGAHRMRATGIPALRELSDAIKPSVGAQTKDTGFINAARTKRADFLYQFGKAMSDNGWTQEHAEDALQAMQAGTGVQGAQTAEGRNLIRYLQGTADRRGLFGDILQYMKDSNVDTKSVQPRADYFPRMYDANAITRNMDRFTSVLERHGFTSAEAQRIAQRIAGSNGAEFNIETEKPGMQFMKQRKLAMIPDAELAPFMKKNLFEIMNSYVTQATRRAEWAARFGDDGLGISRLLEKAKAQGATDDQIAGARKYLKAVDGTLGDSLNPTVRRIMGNALVYENVRLLPLAIFSSVVDPLGVAVRGGTVGDAWRTFKRGAADLRHAWSGEFKQDADSKLAEAMGTIDHAMLDGTTSALYTQGMVGDFAKRVNDTFFKYNLMESFNRSMRIGATRAALDFMTRHADGTANEHSKRWMRELGYEPGEFRADNLDDKAKAAINRWVDGAVLRPDAADKPVWMSDPHYMLVSHLKQFVYSFQETILKRVLHEYRHGNFKPAMALASYVPVMIASDAIKGMLQGGGSQPSWKRDWGPAEYAASGVERSGMLGVAQFAIDGPGMLAGPTAQHLLQIAEAADGKASAGHVFAKSLPVVDAFTEAGPTFSE